MTEDIEGLVDYKSPVELPYVPEGLEIVYVKETNPFMAQALRLRKNSSCFKQQTGAVIVRLNEVIGVGWNGKIDVKKLDHCPKDKAGFGTGEGYHICEEVCHHDLSLHAEQEAVKDTQRYGAITEGAVMYLAGHWWACKPCCDAVKKAGIEKLIFVENATELFRH